MDNNSALDLEQMFSDIEDYLIIVEDLVSELSIEDKDFHLYNEIVGCLENVLDKIDKIWYNSEN